MVADFRVDAVSKVNRDGALRQVDDVTLRREDEDLIREDVDLERLEVLLRVAEFLLQVDHLAQPAHLLVDGTRCLGALARFLVFPVRGDAVLRDLMHRKRADLDLERIAARHDRRVQGLIAVRLRHGDVVLEAARDWLPHRVDDAEHAVAVLDRVDEHAHGREVVDLAELLVVALHLLVDAVEMLRAAADVRLDVRLSELLLDLLDGRIDERLALLALLLDVLDEVVVDLRLEIAQAEVLKLPLDARDAEAVRERRVDLDGLARDALLLVLAHVLERAHVVQAVRKLDHDDADVLGHREEHLAVALELRLFLRFILQAAEFRHAVDEHRDLVAEHLLHLVVRVNCVLDDIVQESRADGRIVEVQLREDLGDVQRVDDVRLPRHARLPGMGLSREFIGAPDEVEVGLRRIRFDSVEDVLDRHRFFLFVIHTSHSFLSSRIDLPRDARSFCFSIPVR